MIKCDVKVFVQFKDGVWAIESVGFWNKFGLTGQRATLVVAPMSKREIRDAMPNLADRMTNNCVVVWGHPVAAEQSRGGENPAPFIPVGEPPSAAMTPDQIAEEVLNDARWLDRETLSEHLGISRSTFYRKVAEGQIEVAAVAGRRVYRPRIDAYCKEDVDAGPSYQAGAAAKLGSIIDAAQKLQVDTEVADPSVHQLRTELADLRAKLRYATATAPDGFRLVEGFVSATKGRETPNHTDRMAYIDGVKGRHVTDALAGPSGFIITAPCGVAFSGVVHILERDPARKYQPWPESLTFSVIA